MKATRQSNLFFLFFLVSILSISCSDSENSNEISVPVSDSLVFTDTGLPVVYIKTFSGKEVASKEVYEEATIEIRDGEGNIDIPMQIMEIHGRGNSSWNILWKKRGYTIKLNKKSEVLGMPKDKKWVLIANYRDKTLLRNSVAWWLSERLSALKWTPRYNPRGAAWARRPR